MLFKATALAALLGVATAVPYALQNQGYHWYIKNLKASCGMGTSGIECYYQFDVEAPIVHKGQYIKTPGAKPAFIYACAGRSFQEDKTPALCDAQQIPKPKEKRYETERYIYPTIKEVTAYLSQSKEKRKSKIWIEVIFDYGGHLLTYRGEEENTYRYFHTTEAFKLNPYPIASIAP